MVEDNSQHTQEQKGQDIHLPDTTSAPLVPSVTETTSIIEKADAVAARMEAANKKAEELNNKIEANLARMMLSGRAEAGAPIKTSEQTEEEKTKAEVEATLKRYR